MKNFIPAFIAEKLGEKTYSGSFEATALFLDISGFTALTERFMEQGREGAEILNQVLNEILNPVIDEIYHNNGFIASFEGDAFTAIFQDISNPAAAIQTAVKINQFFLKNGLKKTKFGVFELFCKIGLAYGEILWGILGEKKLKTYFFKGKAIREAIAAENICQKMEIMLSEKLKKMASAEICTSSKRHGFFKLEKIISPRDNEEENKKVTIPKNILKLFIPEEIITYNKIGEFREIVCVFTSMQDLNSYKQLNSFFTKILKLTVTYHGYFEGINFSDKGGNFLTIFGAPKSYENNLLRALDFAWNINKEFGTKIRIGIASGIAFTGIKGSQRRCLYGVLGKIVNLAARMMMQANWQEVWITKNIANKIKKNYQTISAGEKKFKGFSDKIQISILQEKIPISESEYTNILIGREKELNLLKKYINPIFNKEFAGVIYIDGNAGIGKSRLTAELKKNIANKVNWLYLPCDEILRKSFNPFIYFLNNFFKQKDNHTDEQNKRNFNKYYKQLLTKTNDTDIIEELSRTKTIIGGLINLRWKGSLYEKLTAKVRYENTLFAIKNFFKAISLQKPLVIELEDSHWIDSDSRKAIKILTRNVKKYPFVIITTCRFNETGKEFQLGLTELRQKRIPLSKLPENNIQKLISNLLNNEIPADSLKFIKNMSEGNPFYIEQITLYLHENNLFDRNFNIKKKSFSIPGDINAIIISRIDRLTKELQDVIKTASVLGQQFAVNVLTEMMSNYNISGYLYKGKKEKIWKPLSELNYLFRHALIRDAVYQMQLKQRLRELHKLAAETIERLYRNDLEKQYYQLANHYEKAEITKKAIEYLEKAGNSAKNNYQNEQALNFYNKLLNIIGKNKDHKVMEVETLIKKGQILKLVGKWDKAKMNFEKALSLAKKIKDKDCLFKANGGLGKLFLDKGDYKSASKHYQKQLKYANLLANKRFLAVTYSNLGNLSYLQSEFNEAMIYYKKMKKIWIELNDKSGLSVALGNLALVYQQQGNLEKTKELNLKKIKICKEINDKMGISLVTGNIGIYYYNIEKYKKATVYFKEQFEISKELGYRQGIAIALGNMGNTYRILGNYKEAMKCYNQTLQISREHGNLKGISLSLGNIGIIYQNQGNFKKALANYKTQLKICKRLNYQRGIAIAFSNISIIYRETGQLDKALDYCDRAIEIGEKINVKYLLSSFLQYKGELFFILGKNKQALLINKRAKELAIEVKRSFIELKAKILKHKIKFEIHKSVQERLETIKALEELLAKQKKKERVANLNYEIWKLKKRIPLINQKNIKKNRNEAISLLTELYKKTPKIDYKVKISELKQKKANR